MGAPAATLTGAPARCRHNWESGPLNYTRRLHIEGVDRKCQYVFSDIKTSDLYALLPSVPIPDPIRRVPLWARPNRTRPSPDPVRDEPFLLVMQRFEGSEFVDVSTACTDLPLGGTNPEALGPHYFNLLHEDESPTGPDSRSL